MKKLFRATTSPVFWGAYSLTMTAWTTLCFATGRTPAGWIAAGVAVFTAFMTVVVWRDKRKERNVEKEEHDRIYSALSEQVAAYGRYRGAYPSYRVGAAGRTSSGASLHAPGGGTGTRVDEFMGKGPMALAAGSVKGARSFLVDGLGRLTGVTYKQVWVPGENQAECRIGEGYQRFVQIVNGTSRVSIDFNLPDDGHDMTTCRHGFYGYYDGSDDYHKQGMVSGVIEGYGETVVGTRGFRCMKAKIIALYIPEDVPAHLGRLIARNYTDIPLFGSFEQMVAEFPPDSAGNGYSPESDPDFWTRRI